MKSKYAHGATGLWGFPDAQRRGEGIANGLQLMAEQCNTKLIGGLHIDSNGEISLVCEEGFTYGPKLAPLIKKHGARTGALCYGYTMHTQETDCWCRMNHFAVQAMLEEYFAEQTTP